MVAISRPLSRATAIRVAEISILSCLAGSLWWAGGLQASAGESVRLALVEGRSESPEDADVRGRPRPQPPVRHHDVKVSMVEMPLGQLKPEHFADWEQTQDE